MGEGGEIDTTGRRPTEVDDDGDAQRGPAETEPVADEPASAEGFVRFCHERSGAEWPRLYDVMCAVAARAAFRGMAYEELSELGISFALTELPRLAALTERVVRQPPAIGPGRTL